MVRILCWSQLEQLAQVFSCHKTILKENLGKSETLFKNSHQKFERVDRLDEDLAIHILDSILQLNEEPPSDQEHQRLITTIEGEYIQIFNENLLDLLKKVIINSTYQISHFSIERKRR